MLDKTLFGWNKKENVFCFKVTLKMYIIKYTKCDSERNFYYSKSCN